MVIVKNVKMVIPLELYHNGDMFAGLCSEMYDDHCKEFYVINSCKTCKDHYYSLNVNGNNECRECIKGCKQCSDQSSCNLCDYGYAKDASTGKCLPDHCHVFECKTCNLHNELMYSRCENGYELKNGTCVVNPDAIYSDSSSSGTIKFIVLTMISLVLLFI